VQDRATQLLQQVEGVARVREEGGLARRRNARQRAPSHTIMGGGDYHSCPVRQQVAFNLGKCSF